MTCRCSHDLSSHKAGIQSEKRGDDSVETPVWICMDCRCVLTEMPEERQGELALG